MSLPQQVAGRAAVVKDRVRRARREHLGLLARLRALEDEVQENRQLNRRIAELTDVVEELLLPLRAGGEEQAPEVLERYRSII